MLYKVSKEISGIHYAVSTFEEGSDDGMLVFWLFV